MNINAWKTDDKAWLKARRAGWKEVKTTLDRLTGVRGQDKKFLKQFYMSGEIDIDEMTNAFGRRVVDPERPLYPMEASTLLECWLTADQSDENWQQIKEKYGERKLYHSCRRLLESLAYYPETGSLFGGLEERLYRFLCPTRCRPEDYPELNREQYIDQAHTIYGRIRSALSRYFQFKAPNPNNFVRCRLPEWHDCIAATYLKIPDALLKDLIHVVVPMHRILTNPDNYAEHVLDVAKQLEDILSDEALPQPIRDRVDEIIKNFDEYNVYECLGD